MWLHSSVGRASHRYSRRSRVRIPLKPWFFQASSFQLLKLEDLLRWSFFTLIYNRSSNIWIISYILHIIFSTSSNQRLWECVRRRINVCPDTLNDFPSWLSSSQPLKTNLFSSTTGVLQKDISVTNSMPVWWLKTALCDGASFRRLTSLIGLKNLHQLSNFVLNIVTLTCNV